MRPFTDEERQAILSDPQAAKLFADLQRVDAHIADMRRANGYTFLLADWRRQPHPKQQQFFLSTTIKSMFSGAQGTGKSWVLMGIAAGVATGQHPTLSSIIPVPNDIWVVALNYKKVEQVLLPLLRLMIPQGVEKSWDSQSYLMTLHNGSTITFMSAESGPDKFQSNRLDAILFDEAPQKGNGVAVYRECLSRFKPGRPLFIRFACTPWEMPRFFRDEFYLGARRNPAEVECITVGLKENPYITPEQVAYQSRQYVGKEYRARILGEVVDLTGLVFDTITPDHMVDDFPIPPNWPRYRGIDPTEGRRPWSIVWGAVSPEGTLYMYDELEKSGTYDQIVGAIKAKTGFDRIEWTAIDPFASKHDLQTGNPWTSELARLGLDTIKVDRSKRSFYRTQLSKRLGDPERGIRPRMFFFKEGAARTYQSFCNHNWEEWGAGNEDRAAREKEEDSTWKDLVDATLYMTALNPVYVDVEEYVHREESDTEHFEPLDEGVPY